MSTSGRQSFPNDQQLDPHSFEDHHQKYSQHYLPDRCHLIYIKKCSQTFNRI